MIFLKNIFLYHDLIKFCVFNKLKVFKDLAGNQTRSKINAMKCVGGQECNLKKFNAFYKGNGIVKQTTTPYIA